MMKQIVWQSPTHLMPLKKGVVHIWLVNLKLAAEKITELYSLLNADEQRKAERFKFPMHRERYIVSRAALRKILSLYLLISPAAIEFSYGEHGKPYILHQPLFFNMTNSNDFALYAISLEYELGIDVEGLTRAVDPLALAQSYFSLAEQSYLKQLSVAEQPLAFLKLWTAKEAFIKAIGKGLAFPLVKFSVDIEKERIAFIENEDVSEWHLKLFSPAEDFTAALAWQGKETEVIFFRDDKFLSQ